MKKPFKANLNVKGWRRTMSVVNVKKPFKAKGWAVVYPSGAYIIYGTKSEAVYEQIKRRGDKIYSKLYEVTITEVKPLKARSRYGK